MLRVLVVLNWMDKMFPEVQSEQVTQSNDAPGVPSRSQYDCLTLTDSWDRIYDIDWSDTPMILILRDIISNNTYSIQFCSFDVTLKNSTTK
jgi:hypothetical protein